MHKRAGIGARLCLHSAPPSKQEAQPLQVRRADQAPPSSQPFRTSGVQDFASIQHYTINCKQTGPGDVHEVLFS